jgi:two-component system sensor histidine kinase CreC
MEGERFLVRHAVQNLLQNALEFTPVGGRIEVSVRSAGDAVYVECADSGPGVPDYALERIFERFYSLPRPESGRKSSGLGLPFVKEVATLHGGWVTLENRPQGGARAILRLAARA